LTVTASPGEAFGDADVAIVAVPSRSIRDNVRAVRDDLNESAVVVSATKGLELESGKRMSQVLSEELPPSLRPGVCALSGPNLANEIARQKPSSTVVASPNLDAARTAQSHINTPLFRVYTNDDIVGVEFGGALKNIIALGAGICDGLGYGDNAKAAFMTRGLAEISRLGVAAGANPLTFAGLAGIGDLVATCSSGLSRNHTVGEQLAGGRSLEEVRASMDNVAEGVDTTAAAVSLAESLEVEMPIAQATYDVLFNGVPLDQAISELLGRAPRSE
jgi:glycerol-3-phosphate dehydrogenase (NAD(P)+)